MDNIEKLLLMQQRIKSRKNITRKRAITKKKSIKTECLTDVFISGGIGDIVAIDCFLTDSFKININNFFYATHKHQYIKELFINSKYYNQNQNHQILHDDFKNFWCFFSLEDYLNKTKSAFKNIFDLSIYKIFNKIKNGSLSYNKSSFLEFDISLDKFDLPDKFQVIVPFSTDKRLNNRDFNQKDWSQTIEILKHRSSIGVVLNQGEDNVPVHDRIIDLSNQTNVLESIEILKKSNGYIGIDSWISVLTPKILDPSLINIKSINAHCYNNAYCYYAPITKFNFIKNEIRK